MEITENQRSSSPDALPTAPAVVWGKPGGETMRAIILEKFGGLDSLVYADIPKPLPKDGEVVIRIEGFGINHAEMHMRRGEWAEAALGAARVELERRDLGGGDGVSASGNAPAHGACLCETGGTG